MKKIVFSLVVMGVLFSGCGSSDSETPIDKNTTIETPIVDDGSFVFLDKRYNTVVSPYTDRVWLDRNLGANQVCISKTDAECYGDYYQWGRLTDGHEKPDSNLSITEATSITNTNNKFITVEATEAFTMDDWAYAIDRFGTDRVYNWSRIDGGGVCPVEFRVPTNDEIVAEFTLITNADSAFNKFLKLPVAGARATQGNVVYVGEGGYLWSSNASNGDFVDGGARMQYYSTTTTGGAYSGRSNGRAIRCIKD